MYNKDNIEGIKFKSAGNNYIISKAQDIYEDGFKSSWEILLPIIKELGEALKELDFIYGNKDAYTKDTIGYKAAERIRTTLDKYQNYL